MFRSYRLIALLLVTFGAVGVIPGCAWLKDIWSPLPSEPFNFTISGGIAPSESESETFKLQNLSVDDDLIIKVDGHIVFRDEDGWATGDSRGAKYRGKPIEFAARLNSTLEIIALDAVCCSARLSSLYLHHLDGRLAKLIDPVSKPSKGRCGLGQRDPSCVAVFFQQTFKISELELCTPQPRFLQWDDRSQLSWCDYLGKVSSPQYDAMSYTGLTATPHPENAKCVENRLQTEVQAVLDRWRSWVRVNQKSENLLEHEWGHFAISRIFARLTQEAFDRIDCKQEQTQIRDQALSLWDLVNNPQAGLRTRCQNKYETDTRHGTDPVQQQEWIAAIQGGLKFPERFSHCQEEVNALKGWKASL